MRLCKPQVLVSKHQSALTEQGLFGKIVDSRWGKVTLKHPVVREFMKVLEKVRNVRKIGEQNIRGSKG